METDSDLKNFQLPIETMRRGIIDPDYIKKKKGIVVLFYADWCFHCKKLKPIYKQLILENRKDVIIAVVDMQVYDNVIQAQLPNLIMGYPTILSFDNEGRYFSSFQGARNLDNLQKFVDHVGDYQYIKENLEKIQKGEDEIFKI